MQHGMKLDIFYAKNNSILSKYLIIINKYKWSNLKFIETQKIKVILDVNTYVSPPSLRFWRESYI
jgi:hypothetical protein